MKRSAMSLTLLAAMTIGCATAGTSDPSPSACPETSCLRTHQNLDSTLYIQTAAEYEAIALQTFTAARALVDQALADPTWNAVGGSEGSGHPPAVIVDVDETVLDNSAYQARLILDDEVYGRESWRAWVDEAHAPSVPGAVEFAKWASDRGVTMIYLTNRRGEEEQGTRRNLETAGFPVREDIDAVLTRGERPEWGSDKTTRREWVARSFRVLLLIGDDLGDFVSVESIGTDQRHAVIEENRNRWGRQWLVLPNPTYGSWMRALLEGAPEDPAARLRTLYERLDPMRD